MSQTNGAGDVVPKTTASEVSTEQNKDSSEQTKASSEQIQVSLMEQTYVNAGRSVTGPIRRAVRTALEHSAVSLKKVKDYFKQNSDRSISPGNEALEELLQHYQELKKSEVKLSALNDYIEKKLAIPQLASETKYLEICSDMRELLREEEVDRVLNYVKVQMKLAKNDLDTFGKTIATREQEFNPFETSFKEAENINIGDLDEQDLKYNSSEQNTEMKNRLIQEMQELERLNKQHEMELEKAKEFEKQITSAKWNPVLVIAKSKSSLPNSSQEENVILQEELSRSFQDLKKENANDIETAYGKLSENINKSLNLAEYKKQEKRRLHFFEAEEAMSDIDPEQYMDMVQNGENGGYRIPQSPSTSQNYHGFAHSSPQDMSEILQGGTLQRSNNHDYMYIQSRNHRDYAQYQQKLIKFDGSGKLNMFRRVFYANVVNNPTLTDDDKFIELKNNLGGTAAKCLRELDNTAEAVEQTFIELELVYGAEDTTMDLHERFINLPFHQTDCNRMVHDLQAHRSIVNLLEEQNLSVDDQRSLIPFCKKLPKVIISEIMPLLKLPIDQLTFAMVNNGVSEAIKTLKLKRTFFSSKTVYGGYEYSDYTTGQEPQYNQYQVANQRVPYSSGVDNNYQSQTQRVNENHQAQYQRYSNSYQNQGNYNDQGNGHSGYNRMNEDGVDDYITQETDQVHSNNSFFRGQNFDIVICIPKVARSDGTIDSTAILIHSFEFKSLFSPLSKFSNTENEDIRSFWTCTPQGEPTGPHRDSVSFLLLRELRTAKDLILTLFGFAVITVTGAQSTGTHLPNSWKLYTRKELSKSAKDLSVLSHRLLVTRQYAVDAICLRYTLPLDTNDKNLVKIGLCLFKIPIIPSTPQRVQACIYEIELVMRTYSQTNAVDMLVKAIWQYWYLKLKVLELGYLSVPITLELKQKRCHILSKVVQVILPGTDLIRSFSWSLRVIVYESRKMQCKGIICKMSICQLIELQIQYEVLHILDTKSQLYTLRSHRRPTEMPHIPKAKYASRHRHNSENPNVFRDYLVSASVDIPSTYDLSIIGLLDREKEEIIHVTQYLKLKDSEDRNPSMALQLLLDHSKDKPIESSSTVPPQRGQLVACQLRPFDYRHRSGRPPGVLPDFAIPEFALSKSANLKAL